MAHAGGQPRLGPAPIAGEPLKRSEALRASTQLATPVASADQPVRWSLLAKIDGKSPLSIEVAVDIPTQDSAAVARRSATGAPLDPLGSVALPIALPLYARDAREPSLVRVVAPTRLVQAERRATAGSSRATETISPTSSRYRGEIQTREKNLRVSFTCWPAESDSGILLDEPSATH